MAKLNFSGIISNQTELLLSVFKRFYLVAAAAMFLTVVSIYFVENDNGFKEENEFFLTRLIMMLGLSIPLFLSLQLYAENKLNKTMWTAVGALLIIAFLVLYFFSFKGPTLNYEQPTVAIRFLALLLASHGLVAISVYRTYSEINGFWQFNKHLLLRTVTGLFYSGVLYLGIIAALFALDVLFNVSVASETYFQLFIFMACTYNTFFVVGGIKDPLTDYAQENEYPNSLKIFTQYVLLPLMALYLVILYAYMMKIIFQWSLPKGWVSNLVLCFSIAGILAFLLVYPIRETVGNKWVKTFSRAFYFSLIPLIFLLHVSIWTRVAEYGITPERYIILGLTVWLSIITVYFLWSRRDNIIFIPSSLAAMFVLATFGPWGFDGLSEFSQRSRFNKVLREANILKDGTIVPLKDQNSVNDSLKYKINDICDYLVKNHGNDVMKKYDFQPWIEVVDSIENLKEKYYYATSFPFMDKINIDPSKLKWSPYGNITNVEPSYYLYLDPTNKSFDVSGYNKLENLNITNYQNSMVSQAYLNNNNVVIIKENGDSVKINILNEVEAVLMGCTPSCPPLKDPIVIENISTDGKEKYRIIITGSDIRKESGKTKINSINGYLLKN